VWTREEASVALKVSARQLRRLLTAYVDGGPGALVHGNRGRAPAHALPATVREQIVALAGPGGPYAGFNHTHLTEKLNEVEALQVGRTTVRQVLAAAGLRSTRRRRPPKHRSRRPRMGQEGLLVQADGSPHRWLGPDGPEWTLLAGIDDATGRVEHAVFRAQEDAAGYMVWLRRVVETKGIPVALYVDRHGIFQRRTHERRARWTIEEELAGGPLPTQFGRVLEELAIQLIPALSPQAKGRIERLWGTLQDRLVSELRLAGVTTMEGATAFLPSFLDDFNRRFAVPATQPGSAYRAWPPALVSGAAGRLDGRLDDALERIFCFKYARTVGNDNTVSFAEHRLQVLPGPSRRSYARVRVELHERLDGSLAVFTPGPDGVCLATRPAPRDTPLLRARSLARPPLHRPSVDTLATDTLATPLAPAAPVAPPRTDPSPAVRRPHPWTQSYMGIRPQEHEAAIIATWRTSPHRTESPAT